MGIEIERKFLVRGDGCFDSLRVVTDEDGSSTPVRLEEHLARLARSAQVMEIPAPGVSAWTDLVETALERWSTPGEDYIRLAVGRDYADVSPLRGVIRGAGEHRLHVGVTVEPFQADQLPPDGVWA